MSDFTTESISMQSLISDNELEVSRDNENLNIRVGAETFTIPLNNAEMILSTISCVIRKDQDFIGKHQYPLGRITGVTFTEHSTGAVAKYDYIDGKGFVPSDD